MANRGEQNPQNGGYSPKQQYDQQLQQQQNPQNGGYPPQQQYDQQWQQQQNPQNVGYPPQQQYNQQQQQQPYQQQQQQQYQYQQVQQNQQDNPYLQGQQNYDQQGQELQTNGIQVGFNVQQPDPYLVEQNNIKQATENIARLKPLYVEFMRNIQIYSGVNIFFGIIALALFGYRVSLLLLLSSGNSVLLYAAGYLLWSLSAILSCQWYRENQKHRLNSVGQFLYLASFAVLCSAYSKTLREYVVFHANQKQIALAELILDILILLTLYCVSSQYYNPKLREIIVLQDLIEGLPVEHRQEYVRHAKF